MERWKRRFLVNVAYLEFSLRVLLTLGAREDILSSLLLSDFGHFPCTSCNESTMTEIESASRSGRYTNQIGKDCPSHALKRPSE